MAKIGAPRSPVIPRSQVPTAPAKTEPAAAPEASPAPVQAQEVAQQFGSAFLSAGRLASQLVKGFVSNPNAAPRRAEKRSADQAAEGNGARQAPEGEHGSTEAGEPSVLGNAFAALKRTRLFRFRKVRKKTAGSTGQVETASLLVLDDDYAEKERDHHRALSWLGTEQEETSFDQARREALFLQHLERQGEPPSHIVRQLNSQFGVTRDREFKHLLSDQVRPQMDALADRVEQLPTEERRALAALVSRAAHQVGTRSSETFARLLSSAGAAEAAQLAASTGTGPERAVRLEQALRRAASPMYRAALLEAGRDSLETLARDAVRLAPEQRHLIWVSLLRSAGSVELESLPPMAEAVVAGVLGNRRSGVAGTIAEALGPALKQAPEGGSWAVQLIVSLAGRGEVKAAEQLATVLHGLIREARAVCIPVFKNLRTLRIRPNSGGQDEEGVLRELEAVAPLQTALIPACSRVLEQGKALPPASALLIGEALISIASLDMVGAVAPGQRLLRRALLAQERGSQTFLSTLPRVALTLGQPQLTRPLVDNGFIAASYVLGGHLFLEHVGTYTAQALTGPVLARSQKGDASAARVLLRSAIRANGTLFGFNSEGSRLAADILESVRDRPGSMPVPRVLSQLDKIRQKHPGGQKPFRTNTLRDLTIALAGRARASIPPHAQRDEGSREPANLTALEIAVDQTRDARQKAAAVKVPPPEPAPPPRGASRSRK